MNATTLSRFPLRAQNCIDTHPELRASIELEAQKRTRALNLWKKVARAAGWSGAAHMRVMLAHAIRAAAAAGDGGGGGGGNSAERGSTDTLGSVPEGGGGGEMMDVVRKVSRLAASHRVIASLRNAYNSIRARD